ncbi:MAG: biotin/lipoyl-binding protein [Sulfuritalea sp.]|nr:biotin/lipoyl-binding protein [Sulfuritalea sp.]
MISTSPLRSNLSSRSTGTTLGFRRQSTVCSTSSRTAGRVVEVFVEEGQQVAEGARILTLEQA